MINLKATLEAGAFGTNPVNGSTLTVAITYSLKDGSKKATQEIEVQLVYYEKKTDIPPSIVMLSCVRITKSARQ